jgi:DNA-binding FadR family transcriptional regulator
VREPSTKADEIARALEDAIPARELLPGSLLRQEQLSEQFGVSRTPIRETLLFVVRAALESCAADLARDRLTGADLRRLERAEKRFAQLTRARRNAPVRKLGEAAQSARRVFRAQAVWSPSAELDELYALNLEQRRAIVLALSERDAIVRRLVEAHILDSARLLKRALERALERAGYGRPPQFGHRLSWRSA